MKYRWLLACFIVAGLSVAAVTSAYMLFYPGAVFIFIMLTCSLALLLAVCLAFYFKNKNKWLLVPTIFLTAIVMYMFIDGGMKLYHSWYWIHHDPDSYPDGQIVTGHINGSVAINPKIVERESRQTITLRIKCADTAIKPGGGFILRLGKVIPVGGEPRFYDCFFQDMWNYPLQVDRANDQAYVSVAQKNGIKFSLSKPPAPMDNFLVNTYVRDLARYRMDKNRPIYFPLNFARRHEVHIKIIDGRLEPGEVVDLTLGDTSRGSPGWIMPGGEADTDFIVYVDPEGEGKFRMIDSYATLEVGGGAMSKLEVIAPSTPLLGANFTVAVRAMDKKEYLSMLHSGTVNIARQDGVNTDTEAVSFTSRDRGVVTFEASINSPGTYRLQVKDTSSGNTYISNPIWVREENAKRVFWGDLHQHTTLGKDANRTPEWVFEHNRQVDRFDFSAISIHDLFDYWRLPPSQNEMAYLETITDKFNEPGEFVTLKGFEWTTFVPGHRNIYYPDNENYEIVTWGQAGTPDELISLMAGKKYMVVPHHSAWRFLHGDKPYNWGDKNCEKMRLVEIYSKHGSSDYYEAPYPIHHDQVPFYLYLLGRSSNRAHEGDGSYVREALAAGYRMGIIAGSDNHWARGGKGFGTGITADYPNGLQAVYAPQLTRTDVYNAMWMRETYGTTGARMIIDFTVNGHPMGSEISNTGNAVEIAFSINGTAPVCRVELWRFSRSSGYDKVVFMGSGGMDIEKAFRGWKVDENSFYFIHVVQDDGQLGWSSPVWIDVSS